MSAHRYAVGETVRFSAPPLTDAPDGDYTVVRQLPSDGAEYWYRIKSAREPCERAAGESRLRPAQLAHSALGSSTGMHSPETDADGADARHKSDGLDVNARTNARTAAFGPLRPGTGLGRIDTTPMELARHLPSAA